MKVYEFNENGVCTNPDVKTFEIKNLPSVCIKTAQHQDKWYMGITIHTSIQGIGIPVSISKHIYKTQAEAEKEGKEFASNYLKNIVNDDYSPGKEALKRLIKIIEQAQQGKLF